MRKNRLLLVIVTLIAAMLACNLPSSQPPTEDPSVAFTAAAQTIAVQLTSAALSQAAPLILPSPTATLTPTNTVPIPTIAPATLILPSPTSNCDSAAFITDVTVADNTVMTPGQTFTKTWRLKNTGTCSWTPSYSVVYASGNQMGGPSSQALVGNVNPGQTADISVALVAPATPGTYRGDWKLRNASGTNFSSFYVQIIVSSGGGGGAFTVTNVSYALTTWSDAGHVNCPRIVAYITTNAAGTITYTWKSSSGTNPSKTLTFPAAGTQAINYDWARGSVWAGTPDWVGIYINDPNNEDFGHLNFTTACTSP